MLKLFNINFTSCDFNLLIKLLKKPESLLFVFPAAPALSEIFNKKKYYASLRKADYIILESSLIAFMLFFKYRKLPKKISGYLFVKKFLEEKLFTKSKILLLEPNQNSEFKNIKLLIDKGYEKKNIFSYICPFYNNSFNDIKLIKYLLTVKPNYVFINIGGLKQEILGLYIRENILTKGLNIKVLCTGAALSFINGEQAPVNAISDKFYLSWLVRCLHNPKIFFPRYLKAFKLICLFLKYDRKDIA